MQDTLPFLDADGDGWFDPHDPDINGHTFEEYYESICGDSGGGNQLCRAIQNLVDSDGDAVLGGRDIENGAAEVGDLGAEIQEILLVYQGQESIRSSSLDCVMLSTLAARSI